LISGVKVYAVKKNVDERGYFAELFRDDWRNLIGDDRIAQFSLAYSHPGVIRAWHRHLKGQNDYVICIEGAVMECVFDDRAGSTTRGELDELVLNSKEPLQVARIVGACWHGYKVIGQEPALILYGATKLYDYDHPDEARLPWNDGIIVPTSINGRKNDSRVGRPYGWNAPEAK
jgi:dTDP-4-dehydrorhamnose 3,5-epimerase